MLVPLLILLLELVAIRALAPVFVLMFDRRTQNRVVTQLVGPAILFGYIGGGTVAWSLVPPEWQMSFRETLAAFSECRKVRSSHRALRPRHRSHDVVRLCSRGTHRRQSCSNHCKSLETTAACLSRSRVAGHWWRHENGCHREH
jgi:hypothetical protein